ncbi:MAG: hypothetical protein NVV67_11685 [Pseudoxanthomonas sp.]|nr:hypothetical protein [Pseudoxanthomonas sp.]
MFGELVAFLDVLKSTVADLRGRKASKEREETIATLLRTYFLLKDAAEEGAALVEDARPNPVEVIQRLEPALAEERLANWNRSLRRQTARLMGVSSMVYSQEFMDVVSPDLRERLYDVLGSKVDRATSLHGIGAALFFRGIVIDSPEEQARYVSIMAGEEGDLLHMDKIQREVDALQEALESYRQAVTTLATPDEIIRLTRDARAKTTFPAA